MKRAIRRHHARRLKAKIRRIIEHKGRYAVYEPSGINIGRYFQIHGAFCKTKLLRFLNDRPTIQDERNNLRWLSEKGEIN